MSSPDETSGEAGVFGVPGTSASAESTYTSPPDAEARLRQEAQARLAAIVESSDDAIVSKTLDGIVRTWNKGAERIFGYSAAEMVGKPIQTIIPPERLQE